MQVALQGKDVTSLVCARQRDGKVIITHATNISISSILAPHSNIISMLLLSRCMWPPMRMRALISRALAHRLHAAVALQCSFRAHRARTCQRKLAAVLPPALYRSQRCLAAVRLLQRTFISHRVSISFIAKFTNGLSLTMLTFVLLAGSPPVCVRV